MLITSLNTWLQHVSIMARWAVLRHCADWAGHVQAAEQIALSPVSLWPKGKLTVQHWWTITILHPTMKMWPARNLKPLLWKIKGAYCLSTVSLTRPPTSKLAYRCNASCAGTRKSWTKPTGFDTGLTTYNSLTKQREPLILAQEGIATWYGRHGFWGHFVAFI